MFLSSVIDLMGVKSLAVNNEIIANTLELINQCYKPIGAQDNYELYKHDTNILEAIFNKLSLFFGINTLDENLILTVYILHFNFALGYLFETLGYY